MKKVLTSLILVILLTPVCSGQTIKKGLKGGLNYSNIKDFGNFLNVEDVSSLTSWHVGTFINGKISIVSVQGELIYSVQGSNFADSTGTDHKLTIAYINIPIIAKVYLIPGKLNLHGGIQYGYKISSKVDGSSKYLFTSVWVDDLFANNDWAIPLGIGLDVSKIMLELRYNIGVGNINDVSISDTKLSNGVFQASIGYVF